MHLSERFLLHHVLRSSLICFAQLPRGILRTDGFRLFSVFHRIRRVCLRGAEGFAFDSYVACSVCPWNNPEVSLP